LEPGEKYITIIFSFFFKKKKKTGEKYRIVIATISTPGG
jgi:hypothetical protein